MHDATPAFLTEVGLSLFVGGRVLKGQLLTGCLALLNSLNGNIVFDD